MLRSLGLGKIIQGALLLMVVVAVYEAFNGDFGAMIAKAIDIVKAGAEIIRNTYDSLQERNNSR